MELDKSESRSPREVGAERAKAALAWLRRWGWSSPAVLDALTRSTRRGLAARLERAKMAEAIEIDFYSIAIAPLPKKLVKLTEMGQQVAETFCSNVKTIYEDIARPKPQQLLHDIKVQEIAAKYVAKGAELVYSAPELNKFVKSGKIPDAVIEIDGKRTAIELELSKKRDDEFYFGIEALCESLKNKRFDSYVIYCSSTSIADRYKKTLIPDMIIDRYVRAENRHLKKTKNGYQIPTDIALKVKIFELKP
ncbi:MAG: hypothetical protein ACK4Q6_12130 [Tepidimonas ignava]|uniref:hypothetical protein n=1 Tax=Tepidimonas ignava TaxID=114249 RepID=UPI00391C3B85